MVPPGLVLESRYRLEDPIAAGGMGEVWRARDLILGRGIAVKLLHLDYTRDEVCLARFRAEAQHAGSLSHPNIAQVYDYNDAARPYLVMELVDGPSLAALLAEGPLDPARAMQVIAQAAGGLQAVHAAGLVHRDVKPGNLLITRGGQVKVTDFGIAHAAGAPPVTRTGTMMGTPAYLAPERAAGASATPAADLYALGVVAYQCLTGRLPFDGEPLAVAIAHMEQELPPLPLDVPPGAAALVADLTAKDPRARPSCAAQVAAQAEQLRAALSGPGTPYPPPPSPPAILPAIPTGGGGREPAAAARTSWQSERGSARVDILAGHKPAWRGWPRARPAAVLAGLAAAGLGTMLLATSPGSLPAHRHPPTPVASPPSAARPGVSPSGDPQTVGISNGGKAHRRRGRPSTTRAPTPAGTPTPSGTSAASATPSPTPSGTPSPAVSASTPPGTVIAEGP